MPGIAGIIRRFGSAAVDHEVRTMVDVMRHAEHYSRGEYGHPELGISIGWTTHPESYADGMPVVTASQDVVLVFLGEDHGDADAPSQTSSGADRARHGAAARILELYVERGDDALLELNGWFSGVIVDLKTRRITLFNDRYGMGRVYIHQGADEFLFASEAKALLKIRPALRAIDPAALAQSLRFGCVTGHKTLFPDIGLLPNASAWRFEGDARPKEHRYFDFAEWEQQPELPAREFYPRFAETFSRVVPLYARESPAVAVSLTAGLDTRAIVAALGSSRTFPCYTFGGRWGELYDIRVARKIAALYGQSFATITVGDRFLNRFEQYARTAVSISDGTLDALCGHDVYFNEVAREIAPIRLTGKFGSEIVRARKLIPWISYDPKFPVPGFATMLADVPPFSAVSRAAHPLTRVVAEELPWYEFGRVAVEQSQLVLRTPYMDNALVKLMYQAPAEVRSAGDLQDRYVRETSPELSRYPTDLGRFVTTNRFLTPLVYGLMRVRFKSEYVYLYGMPHWMTRVDRALERLRPERLAAGRHKWEGYRIWLKTDLADFVRSTLLSPAAHYQAYFDRRTVEAMVTRHLAGTHNYLHEINRALTVELIHTTLLKA